MFKVYLQATCMGVYDAADAFGIAENLSLSLTRKMCVCVCGEDASHQYFTIRVYYWTLNAAAKSILYVFVYLCVCGVRVCELKMLWLKRRKKLSEKKHSLTLEHIYEMTCLWVKCYCTTINKNWTLNGQNWDLDRLRVTVGNGIREKKHRTAQNKHKPNNHCMRQRIGFGSTFLYFIRFVSE